MEVRIIADTFINSVSVKASDKIISLPDRTARELIINSKAEEVKKVVAKKAPGGTAEQPQLEEMTNTELKAELKTRGIEIPKKAKNKAQLIELFKTAD